ncbi:Protein F35G2.1 a [Aphelenchoides avenae]|nr:Protein F35G2.1 a [Aphelenchus avenae]
MTYVPQGSNPLLFTPGVDPIMHLDQSTFADTVFDPTNTNAFLVEFYADWCGHCRAFAPYYKDLSQKVGSWGDIVRVSAMNCADNFNSQTCRANGVSYFPMLKYFPRTAKTYNDGMLLEASHSGANLRDQLADKVLNEYNRAGYQDWPNFRYLEVTAKTKYEDLWDGVPPAANFLVIIFEQYNSIGAQTILDLHPYRAQIGVRRALSTSPLVSMLKISMFPYVAMFRRGDQQAIFMSQYGASTVQDILSRVQPGLMITQLPPVVTTTRAPVIDCNAQPERCKSLYYVSETDMLKAVRAALLDEVTRANDFIRGQNFTNLYNFLVLLSEQFPTVSFENTVQRRTRSTSMVLRNSERARMVFSHLKELMDKKPGVISTSEWKNQFENIEVG